MPSQAWLANYDQTTSGLRLFLLDATVPCVIASDRVKHCLLLELARSSINRAMVACEVVDGGELY